MKKPQSDRAKARRTAAVKSAARVCPTHGDKLSTTFLLFRCGCPNS